MNRLVNLEVRDRGHRAPTQSSLFTRRPYLLAELFGLLPGVPDFDYADLAVLAVGRDVD